MGQPITWRNIAAPTFNGAMVGMDKAAERLDGAFDPLEKIVDEQKMLKKIEYQEGIKNNDIQIQAGIQNLKDLASFNAAEERGDFRQDNLQGTYGTQFTAQALTDSINQRRKELQDNAVNTSLINANSIADKELSLAKGGTALEQELVSLGMTPLEARNRTANYLTQNAGREASYKEAINKNTQTLLDQINPAQSNKDILKGIATAKASGLKFDESKLMQVLGREKTGFQQDTAYNQQQTEIRRVEKNRELSDQFYTQGMAAIQAGKPIKQITGQLNSMKDVPSEVKARVSGQLLDIYARREKFTDLQQVGIKNVQDTAIRNVGKKQVDLDRRVNLLDQEIKQYLNYSDSTKTFVDKALISGKTIPEALRDKYPDTALHWNVENEKQGDKAASLLSTQYNFIKENLPGIDEKEAGAILVAATTDVESLGQVANLRGPDTLALAQKEFVKAVTNRINNFKHAQQLQTIQFNLKRDGQEAIHELTNKNNNYIIDNLDHLKKQNVSSSGDSGTKFMKQFQQGLPADNSLDALFKKYDAAKKELFKKTDTIDEVGKAEKILNNSAKVITKPVSKPGNPNLATLNKEQDKLNNIKLPIVETSQGIMINDSNGMRKPTRAEQKKIAETLRDSMSGKIKMGINPTGFQKIKLPQ